MTRLFTAYRVLAITVGVCLLLASIDWVLHRIDDGFPDLWWLWMLHGYVYLVYLAVALVFVRRARWSLEYVGLIIVAGLVPILMFVVEHFVSRRFKREHPELFGLPA
ncbi:MAG: DUF3817 domain-containing protein [Nocardioides sp.]|uniref:DUF3817 domain-containing protein n=1 Tax=Nocardioides sp. TaxID=35761 RepID=UPI0039E5BB71